MRVCEFAGASGAWRDDLRRPRQRRCWGLWSGRSGAGADRAGTERRGRLAWPTDGWGAALAAAGAGGRVEADAGAGPGQVLGLHGGSTFTNSLLKRHDYKLGYTVTKVHLHRCWVWLVRRPKRSRASQEAPAVAAFS